MATASDIVRRSLVLIGVVEAGETLSAAAAKDGLAALNEMLLAWGLESADTAHSEVVGADDLLVRDEFLEPIRFNLATRLAPEYGKTVTRAIEKRADKGFLVVQAALAQFDDDLHVDRALDRRWFKRRLGAYNINLG